VPVECWSLVDALGRCFCLTFLVDLTYSFIQLALFYQEFEEKEIKGFVQKGHSLFPPFVSSWFIAPWRTFW
jgi:hypothetical protein